LTGLHDQVAEATAAVRGAIGSRSPRAAIILGSGLGGLADRLTDSVAIPYSEIPHFPRSTAQGHAGRLVVGDLPGADATVVAMQGRFHLYEGWSPRDAALPVYVLRALGAGTLCVTNAAGGINPTFKVGDVMLIDDHINLMFRNPLVGVNDDRLGARFPDMSAPYDRELLDVGEQAARRGGFAAPRGVYVGMLGPTYETRAEYRMLRSLGGDAAGMSTVPEVVAARHAGMRVFGVSTITNECSPDALGETTHDDVIAAAASAGEKLLALVTAAVRHAVYRSAQGGE
jgi:purine-nucleoside phosphorylase